MEKRDNKLFSRALFKQSCKANGVMWSIITIAVCFMLACVMLISSTSSISSVKDTFKDTIVQETIKSSIKKTSVSEYSSSVDGEELFDTEFTAKFNEINTLDTYTNSYVPTLTTIITNYVSSDEVKEAITQEVTTKVTEYMQTSEAQTKIAQYMATGLTQDEAITKLKNEKVSEYSTSVTNEYIAKAKADKSLQSQAFVTTYVTPCYTYAINKVIDKYTSSSSAVVTINPNNQADSIYKQYKEEIPEEYVTALTSYMTTDVLSVAQGQTSTTLSDYIKTSERSTFRQNRAYNASSMLVAGKMTEDATINTLLETLSEYGITKEKYQEMGFTYDYVHKLSYEASLEYQDKLTYEISLLDSNLSETEYNEKVAQIKADLNTSVAGSLLDKLPEDVSSGIEELGKMDLYGLIVGSIFFKMAGLLLPIIYLIMASNNLIAGQVDSGSMAYVLSTSTKRKQVTFTQGLFLVSSLFLMFVCTTITSVVCFTIANVTTDLTYGKLILINLGAFVVLFAMSGINFFTSCYFDRSKKAMAIGGGLSMFFLVATMLGLFGSPVIPSVVRIGALNYFNYVSVISLFDVVSILNVTTDWIWKLAILVAIGLLGYILGSIKFKKKDLPL
jgi:hypothetical protein